MMMVVARAHVVVENFFDIFSVGER
jgi:hypothetical protein